MAEQGYAFDDIPIYDILVEQTELARLKTADYITFESGSGVRGFFAGREAEAASLFETVRPVCIGKVTAAVLAEYGVKNTLTASDYTADGILEVLLADRNEIAR
ncbi:MAG: uroporphyrinogen-III synthase [Pilosibacter sp.]